MSDGDDRFYWRNVQGLTCKLRLHDGNADTEYWVTRYNRWPKWTACGNHAEIAHFERREEAMQLCEVTYLLETGGNDG